jgi:hypothetical protein
VAEASDGILRVLCEALKFDLGEIWQVKQATNRLAPRPCLGRACTRMD